MRNWELAAALTLGAATERVVAQQLNCHVNSGFRAKNPNRHQDGVICQNGERR
jgi:hypothetical protein